MSAEAWLTLGIILATVVAFVTERVAPPVTMAGAVLFLYLTGVIEFDEAFSGFSNSAPITVAA